MLKEIVDRPAMLRVLIADDHELVRQGLVALLSREADIRVVGQAGTGREVVALVLQEPPDVVLMDVSMPDMDGVQATLAIKTRHPGVRVVALSMFREAAVATQMLDAGADAYIHKGGPVAEVLQAIRGRK